MQIAITGTTTGIGRACVELLQKENYGITEINRDLIDLENVEQIKQINLARHDVLINNAGHGRGSPANLKNCRDEDIISMIKVNLIAPILLAKRFIEQNPHGKIINITSTVVKRKQGGSIPYDVSKHGLQIFTECLRDELKDQYQCIEIIPGRTKTAFKKNAGHTDHDAVNYTGKYQYAVSAQEVADVVLQTIKKNNIFQIEIQHPFFRYKN